MKWSLFRRITLLVGVAVILLGFLSLFTFDIIKIDWVSFMEIQPAYQPMNDPLPVPPDSIPVDGPAYIAAVGVPDNPEPGEAVSVDRGNELFHINCVMCHGPQGRGNGPVAVYLQNKPADLTGLAVQSLTDGGIFMTISNGVQGKMPALNENLTVQERWDVVNFVRTLK
jgi:mono/diheme cytochrome c family protein